MLHCWTWFSIHNRLSPFLFQTMAPWYSIFVLVPGAWNLVISEPIPRSLLLSTLPRHSVFLLFLWPLCLLGTAGMFSVPVLLFFFSHVLVNYFSDFLLSPFLTYFINGTKNSKEWTSLVTITYWGKEFEFIHLNKIHQMINFFCFPFLF